jgi:UDP-3-O-[3-hydroxymyristoyl] glucosamine N-acyltransferase
VQRTVQELAALVQGRVLGDGSRVIQRATTVELSEPGTLVFVESERYLAMLPQCQASAAIVPDALVVKYADQLPRLPATLSLIVVEHPLTAFVELAAHLRGERRDEATGIDPRAVVHPSAVIGPEASIHPYAVIGEGAVLGARCRILPGAVVGRRCRLGEDVTLHPHAVLYDDVVLGDRVIIHANAVIGADGFGYRLHNGRHVKMPQLGGVEIGADVEIGACSMVDRGVFTPTRVGDGTKIDNLVQIGHNCQIGKHNILASQTGLGGSCTSGNYAMFAGQSGIADHLHIGEKAAVGAKSGVSRNIPDGIRVFGIPARPESEFKRLLHGLSKLPEMLRDLRAIQRRLGIDGTERAAG